LWLLWLIILLLLKIHFFLWQRRRRRWHWVGVFLYKNNLIYIVIIVVVVAIIIGLTGNKLAFFKFRVILFSHLRNFIKIIDLFRVKNICISTHKRRLTIPLEVSTQTYLWNTTYSGSIYYWIIIGHNRFFINPTMEWI
jgi:hypothetical protein